MSGPQFLAAPVFAVAAAMHTGTGRTDGEDAGMHGSTDRLRVRGGSGGASMPFILSRSRGGGWLGWGGESGREEKWKERGKHELRVVFRVCLGGRLWPVTDLAETWCGDSGHPKKSLETHIFEFGPNVRDLEHIFQKNVKFVFWL